MYEERFMRRALFLAGEAGKRGEVPVGCVITRGGEIVGEGSNRREEGNKGRGAKSGCFYPKYGH